LKERKKHVVPHGERRSVPARFGTAISGLGNYSTGIRVHQHPSRKATTAMTGITAR